MALTALDIIVLVAVLGAALLGLKRGFVTEVLSLFAWVAIVAMLKLFHVALAAKLSSVVGTPSGAAVAAFVVIAGALWFGVAVLCHSRKIEAPLNLFQALWEPLFTPAIGLLMAAALLSGVLSWWQRRGQR